MQKNQNISIHIPINAYTFKSSERTYHYPIIVIVFEELGSEMALNIYYTHFFCLNYLSLEKFKRIWSNSFCWFLSPKPLPKCHVACHVNLPCRDLWTSDSGPREDSQFSSLGDEWILTASCRLGEHRKKSRCAEEEVGMRLYILGRGRLEALGEMVSKQLVIHIWSLEKVLRL